MIQKCDCERKLVFGILFVVNKVNKIKNSHKTSTKGENLVFIFNYLHLQFDLNLV